MEATSDFFHVNYEDLTTPGENESKTRVLIESISSEIQRILRANDGDHPDEPQACFEQPTRSEHNEPKLSEEDKDSSKIYERLIPQYQRNKRVAKPTYYARSNSIANRSAERASNRLFNEGQNRLNKLRQKLLEKEKLELKQCTFKPFINPRSRKLSKLEPLPQRADSMWKARNERLEAERYRKLKEEMDALSFTPNIISQPKWKPRVQHKYCNGYANCHKKEEPEPTFKPTITAKSAEICAEASKLGRRQRIWNRPISRTAMEDCNNTPTFQPTITRRSKSLDFADSTVQQGHYKSASKRRMTTEANSSGHPSMIEGNNVVYKSEYAFIVEKLLS